MRCIGNSMKSKHTIARRSHAPCKGADITAIIYMCLDTVVGFKLQTHYPLCIQQQLERTIENSLTLRLLSGSPNTQQHHQIRAHHSVACSCTQACALLMIYCSSGKGRNLGHFSDCHAQALETGHEHHKTTRGQVSPGTARALCPSPDNANATVYS
jgi:hypothetical protein